MTKEQKRKAHHIAEHYGTREQKEVAVEECAELILAIKKHYRKAFKTHEEVRESLRDVASEIADVKIMCEQLSYLYAIDSEVAEQIDFKIARQLERMEKGE